MFSEIKRSGNVKLLDRRPVVQECQKLDFRCAKIHHRRLEVGFELNALQFKTIQIRLRQIAGVEAGAIHVQLAVPVVQILSCVLEYSLGLQDLNERASQIEEQATLLIGV